MNQFDLGQEVDGLLDDVLAEMGLADLEADKKTALKKKLQDTLTESVITRVVVMIPEMEKEALLQLNPDSFADLLEANSINLLEIAIEEGTEMRRELKETAAYAQGYLDGASS